MKPRAKREERPALKAEESLKRSTADPPFLSAYKTLWPRSAGSRVGH